MHHGSNPFLNKIAQIEHAQALGKITLLVNTVWQGNPNHYDACLAKLHDLTVRGVASARDLQGHGVLARRFIDLSYYASIDEDADSIDLSGMVVSTDFHTEAIGFAWPSTPAAAQWQNLDMREITWSSLVKSLRTASILVAGRHHGMYAACRAGIPFVPFVGNTHKFEDLLWSAGSRIPIAQHLREVPHLIDWALKNRGEYRKLFEWMETQPRWRLDLQDRKPGTEAGALEGEPQSGWRAMSASLRRDHAAAAAHWAEHFKRNEAGPGEPRRASRDFFNAGDVARAMSIINETRSRRKHLLWPCLELKNFAENKLAWRRDGSGPDWWVLFKRVARDSSFGDDVASRRGMRAAMAEVEKDGSALEVSSALFLMACKLVAERRHDLAFEFRQEFLPVGTPPWAKAQEDSLLLNLWRRFDSDAVSTLGQIARQPVWKDVSCRLEVFRFRRLWNGADRSLLSDIGETLETFPTKPALKQLYYSVAGEAGVLKDVIDLSSGQDTIVDLEKQAEQILVLANTMVASNLSNSHLLLDLNDLFLSMQEETGNFLRDIEDQSRRVALVGNSPIELGRGRGPAIDAYETVIRMNEFRTAPPFDRDYGTKTIYAVETFLENQKFLERSDLEDVVIILRRSIYEKSKWKEVLYYYKQGMRFGYLPHTYYKAAAKLIGCTPSVGFLLALLIKTLRTNVNRSDFFGFSFTDQVRGDRKAHYFDSQPPSMIHDWEREAVAFANLFQDGTADNEPCKQ